MKYKLVEPITPRVIFEKLPSDCPSALGEFHLFLAKLTVNGHSDTYSADDKISESLMNDLISNHEVWGQFLLSKNLIMESEPELTFSIGDKFQSTITESNVWILAAVNKWNRINLIRIGPNGSSLLGERYTDKSGTAVNLHKITDKEFRTLVGNTYSLLHKIEPTAPLPEPTFSYERNARVFGDFRPGRAYGIR